MLPDYKRSYYRLVTAVAFHTGLSKVDLDRLERRYFDDRGELVCRRHRTGELVVAWVPLRLLAMLPASGPLFPRRWSEEQFRRDFRRIVEAAGLSGTFKTLRKSSGTEADRLTGRGHEHLANSRRVFETHYLDRTKVHRRPIRLRLPSQ